MPFAIEKRGEKWAVVTKGTGKVHGLHASKDEAEAQMKALYANVPEAKRDDLEVVDAVDLGVRLDAMVMGSVGSHGWAAESACSPVAFGEAADYHQAEHDKYAKAGRDRSAAAHLAARDAHREAMRTGSEADADKARQASVDAHRYAMTHTDIAEREGVSPESGEHKYGDVKFADPKNKKYPVDTAEHIRAAWNYIHKKANAAKYAAADVAAIKSHIVAAWRRVIGGTPPAAKEDSVETVRRYDALGSLTGTKRLENGYLRTDGLIARTGIQTYKRGDGSTIREYRPADEVTRQDSLASLEMLPITDEHPRDADGAAVMLDSENTQRFSRGHLGENIEVVDRRLVKAPLLITDAKLVEKIVTGQQSELSVGYYADLDYTPGEYQGQRYDCVQRNIRGNHVAITRSARGGSELRVRLDASDAVSIGEGHTEDVPAFDADTSQEHTVKIRFDNTEVEVTDAIGALIEKERAAHTSHCATLQTEVTSAKQAVTTAQTETTKEKARADAAEAGKVAAEARVEQVRKDSADQARAQMRARMQLESAARTHLGPDYTLDGVSDLAVKRAVIAKVLPYMKLDGKTDTYIEVAYDHALAEAAHEDGGVESEEGLAALRRADGAHGVRHDDGTFVDSDAARQKLTREYEDAWKKPLNK